MRPHSLHQLSRGGSGSAASGRGHGGGKRGGGQTPRGGGKGAGGQTPHNIHHEGGWSRQEGAWRKDPQLTFAIPVPVGAKQVGMEAYKAVRATAAACNTTLVIRGRASTGRGRSSRSGDAPLESELVCYGPQSPEFFKAGLRLYTEAGYDVADFGMPRCTDPRGEEGLVIPLIKLTEVGQKLCLPRCSSQHGILLSILRGR